MTRPLLITVLLVALAGAFAALAIAATRNGVTPISPQEGDTVPRGKAPTFSARARGGGEVYVHVCRSKATRSDGLICSREAVGRARRGAGGLHRYRPRTYDYPEHWLNTPGVYYWQAHRIRCERRRTKDCRQEGPVSSLRVR